MWIVVWNMYHISYCLLLIVDGIKLAGMKADFKLIAEQLKQRRTYTLIARQTLLSTALFSGMFCIYQSTKYLVEKDIESTKKLVIFKLYSNYFLGSTRADSDCFYSFNSSFFT